MNAAAFGAATDGCTLTAPGSYGPDRVTHNVYDAAGQLTQVQKAYSTSLQQNYATYEYTPNGKQKAVIDANGNRAELTWDGFDREQRWIFPSPTTAGVANQADYEEYGYDTLGNRTSLRKRDGVTLTYSYDGMNRMTLKTVPASATGAAEYNVYYNYDVNGLQTYARFGSASGPVRCVGHPQFDLDRRAYSASSPVSSSSCSRAASIGSRRPAALRSSIPGRSRRLSRPKWLRKSCVVA
jgi:YD repeat-containing protein